LPSKNEIKIKLKLIHFPETSFIDSISLKLDNDKISILPDTAAKSIAKLLNLNQPSRSQVESFSEVPNPDAYICFLQTVVTKPKTAEDYLILCNRLEECVQLDPDYVPAFAELGHKYLQYAGKVGGRSGYYEKSEQTLLRAFTLNRQSLRALYYLGLLYAKTGKSQKSVYLFQQGISINPYLPQFYSSLGYVYRYAGLMEESIKFYKRAQVLNSSYSNIISTQGQITKSLIYLSKYSEALRSQERVNHYVSASGKRPNEKQLFYEGVIYFYSGDLKNAYSKFDSSFETDNSSVWSAFGQAYKYAASGNNKKLLEILKQLNSREIKDSERRYRMVHFYSMLNDSHRAFDNLEKSIDGGFFNYPYIISDPLTKNIHNNERFNQLCNHANLLHEKFKRKSNTVN